MIDYRKYPLPRIRHHAAPTLYLPKEQFTYQLQHYPPLYSQLPWHELYTLPQQPTHLDVGCGMGRFLIEQALTYPHHNFLGLEVRKTAIEWIQTVLSGEGIHNAAAIWYSVANGLPFLENNSIEEIYYFFPDPWIKKRHHKRRAFTAELLQEFHRIIKPEGTLYLMTDVPEVDEYQLALLAETRLFDVTHIHTDDDWHLQIRTDQEMFSQRKNIPYVRRIAKPC